MKHLNIKIKGRVQGTGFRYTTHKLAETLGVKGFIRNEPDGSIYIEAEGNDELNEFTTFLKTGPRLASIEKIEIEEGLPKDYGTFEIKY